MPDSTRPDWSRRIGVAAVSSAVRQMRMAMPNWIVVRERGDRRSRVSGPTVGHFLGITFHNLFRRDVLRVITTVREVS